MNKKEISMERAKEKWDCEKCSFSEAQHGQSSSGLILWPPKNYNCSFCRREFRSAQALGGHMNVHRRDRARLRMLPPPLLQYRNPNPIPSFASSSSSSSSLSSPPSNKLLLPGPGPATCKPKPLVSASLNTLSSSPSSIAFTNEEKKRLLEECPHQQIDALSCTLPSGDYLRKKKNMRAAFGAGNCYSPKREIDVLRKKEESAMSLELEMGLKDTKEAVDLELRLGYP